MVRCRSVYMHTEDIDNVWLVKQKGYLTIVQDETSA